MKKVYLLFTSCLAAFILNLVLMNSAADMPEFFTSYLNDLLCMPIVLSICLFLIKSFSRKKSIRISLFSAFSLAALYSVYFEIYLPQVNTRYTADFTDALLYFSGSLIFWLTHQFDSPKNIQKTT